MSKRHRDREAILPPKVELRAHAHNERHRVHSELHEVVNLVSHGVEPDDVIEPGPNWSMIDSRPMTAESGSELLMPLPQQIRSGVTP